MSLAAPVRHLWVWYGPLGIGGVESFLLRLARGYAGSGVEMCLAGVQSFAGPLRPELEAAGVHLLDWTAFYPAYLGQTPAADFQGRLLADLERLQPSVIAVNDCTDFATGTAPLLHRLRPFCTILDVFHSNKPGLEYLNLRRPYLDVVEGFASSNGGTLERLHHRYPRTRRLPTRYIPYAADVPDRPRRPPGEVLRLLFVGRLVTEAKRILELPAVLDALHRGGRAFTMTLIGDGPQAGELRERLAQRGLLDRVTFAGFVAPDRVTDQLFEHDILLSLSDYEGFSLSVIEALAAGCVPVCTRLPGMDPTAFTDGQTCRLCPVDRLDEMAAILRELTPAALTTLSAGARAAGQRFTVARMAGAYRDFFDELRRRRPVRTWDETATRPFAWDMTKNNPWLPHPHPLKQWGRHIWSCLAGK